MPVILLQAQPPTNLWFLFVAFAVTWLIFFVYAFFISRRRQDLEREIGDLKREGACQRRGGRDWGLGWKQDRMGIESCCNLPESHFLCWGRLGKETDYRGKPV